MWIACLIGAVAVAADSPAVAKTDEAALLASVLDGQADAGARRAAVVKLVEGGASGPVDRLLAELKETKDGNLRRVILQGLRGCRSLPPEAATAVIACSEEFDATQLEEAGEVVGRSIEPKQIRQLIAIASDRAAHGNSRLVATAALGYQQSHSSAKALISLIDPRQLATIQAAAYASLARLTGLDQHGTQRAEWNKWWQTVKDYSESQWREHLLANFTRRAAALAQQRNVLQDRLVTALRQRYRAVPKEERETVLVGMLADPLVPVRALSLELTRELVDMEQPGAPLTDALVARLDDEAAPVRAGATLLLRDLKHAGAADIIAERLASESERDPAVLRAYLLMMKRQPRLEAVVPAIGLLNEEAVRAEAAGALIAAIDAPDVEVDDRQKHRMGQFLREALTSDENLEPQFIELLGRVATDADWVRVERWLGHELDAVKEAAAKTWVAGGMTLAPLAERAGDPVIQAIVIPAATLRGTTDRTLLALIEHKPKNEQMAAAWGRALIAMAARVEPEAVLKADARLEKQNESTDLRLQLISAAVDKLMLEAPGITEPGSPDSERRIFTLYLADLLLTRAEVRLASGDAKAALSDLDRVTGLRIDLATAQLHKQDIIAICARIITNELDEAFAKVAKHLVGQPQNDEAAAMRERVIEVLFTCADKCIATKQTDRATQIISRMRNKLAPVPRELETRLAQVEARIRKEMERTPAGG